MTKRAKMCGFYTEGTRKGYFSCMHAPKPKSKYCPKNTNSRCELIAPKKRVKKLFNMSRGEEYRLTKAWAWLSPDGNVCAATIGRCGSQVRCIISVNVKDIKKVKCKFGKITKEKKG